MQTEETTQHNPIRTIEEIVAFYHAEQANDLLGFTGDVLLPFLPAEQVSEFAKPKDGYEPYPLSHEQILAQMREYMEFSWEKAANHRGISAMRSIEKMSAWLWLLCDDDTRAFAQDSANYPQYGAPILKKICEVYGFPVPDDPGVQRMMQGLPCTNECAEGCGRP